MGLAGMLIFIPLCSVAYTLLRENVLQRLHRRRIPEEKLHPPAKLAGEHLCGARQGSRGGQRRGPAAGNGQTGRRPKTRRKRRTRRPNRRPAPEDTPGTPEDGPHDGDR